MNGSTIDRNERIDIDALAGRIRAELGSVAAFWRGSSGAAGLFALALSTCGGSAVDMRGDPFGIGTPDDHEDVALLSQLPDNIRHVSMSSSIWARSAAIAALAQSPAAASITSLDLSNNARIGMDDVRRLEAVCTLQELNLSGCAKIPQCYRHELRGDELRSAVTGIGCAAVAGGVGGATTAADADESDAAAGEGREVLLAVHPLRTSEKLASSEPEVPVERSTHDESVTESAGLGSLIDGGAHDSLWDATALQEAAVRVMRDIDDSQQGRKLVQGVEALLGNTDTVVSLSECRLGEVAGAAQLIASALANNTTATRVKYVHPIV